MIRLAVVAALFCATAAPAFAVCPRDGSVSRGAMANTVASPPAGDDHGAPAPAATPADQKPG